MVFYLGNLLSFFIASKPFFPKNLHFKNSRNFEQSFTFQRISLLKKGNQKKLCKNCFENIMEIKAHVHPTDL